MTRGGVSPGKTLGTRKTGNKEKRIQLNSQIPKLTLGTRKARMTNPFISIIKKNFSILCNLILINPSFSPFSVQLCSVKYQS